jgi:hypothetical protein
MFSFLQITFMKKKPLINICEIIEKRKEDKCYLYNWNDMQIQSLVIIIIIYI